MGVDLHYSYYNKKCIDNDILPYLSIKPSFIDGDEEYYGTERWLNGNHQADEFYETLRQYGTWNEDNDCWIFDDTTKLFEMAAKDVIPTPLSNYISDYYKDNLVLIIWKK